MKGKHHTKKSKKLLSSKLRGKNNFMYGKIWIFNDKTHESKVISKDESIPVGWSKGMFVKQESEADIAEKKKLLDKIISINPKTLCSMHTSLDRMRQAYERLLNV